MAADAGTIAAIATAPGEAGIAVIRVSGPETGTIVSRVISVGKSGGPVSLSTENSHSLIYGRAINPVDNRVIDEVMLAWMAAPRSFTTEDTAEISCHGGSAAANAVLRAVLAAGARPAAPGEFTLRAFLNGRIALTEAEAVLNVVSAQSSDALERAVDDLRGDMTRRIEPARAAIISALAYLDASADFPDDEIEVSNVTDDLATARMALEDVLAGFRSGRLLGEGATVALVGKPNVGKSSLLNALLRSDRAIVTPVAGTTRDVVSERAVLDGIAVTLLDTAGISASEDPIEQAGVARSQTALDYSAAIVFVFDSSANLTQEDFDVANLLIDRFASGALGEVPVVVAANKSDLQTSADLSQLRSLLEGSPPLSTGQELASELKVAGGEGPGVRADLAEPSQLDKIGRTGIPVVPVSALTGAGIDQLEQAIAGRLRGDLAANTQPSMLTARQHAELDRALLHIRAAEGAIAVGYPTDVLATDVRAASRAIGNVTGEDIDASLLAEIFSRFCIGK